VRRVGVTNVASPVLMAGTNVLARRPDSKRVRLEGRVVANELHPIKTGIHQRLTIDNDNVVFFAEYEGPTPLASPVESRVARQVALGLPIVNQNQKFECARHGLFHLMVADFPARLVLP